MDTTKPGIRLFKTINKGPLHSNVNGEKIKLLDTLTVVTVRQSDIRGSTHRRVDYHKEILI